jgi:hypothetical protein
VFNTYAEIVAHEVTLHETYLNAEKPATLNAHDVQYNAPFLQDSAEDFPRELMGNNKGKLLFAQYCARRNRRWLSRQGDGSSSSSSCI